MEGFTLFIGYGASVLSTIAFLPQAIYVIKTRDTKSISLATYLIFVLSLAFWLVYGLILGDIPILASNFVCIIFSGIILLFKVADTMRKKRRNSQKL